MGLPGPAPATLALQRDLVCLGLAFGVILCALAMLGTAFSVWGDRYEKFLIVNSAELLGKFNIYISVESSVVKWIDRCALELQTRVQY